jgi:hypothetical protein
MPKPYLLAVNQHILKPLLLLSIMMSSFLSLNAQTNPQKFTISGTVYEKGSGETLLGVVIMHEQLNIGTTTNAFGFYSITLPAGEVTLLYRYVGFNTQSITFKLDKNIKQDIYLENSATLSEVVISAEKQERISEESRMSTIDLPVDQIKDIPALLGEKDVLKAVQLLPGVQKGSEGNAGFYVRGGGPDQNLIILDDATVYNANHLFGFFSLFNGDALKSIELTKGGFPARYGGRLSSVLEMRMKDGNKESFKGEAGIGLISSRLTLEGPVVKGKSSFLVSGRRTYLDILTQPLIAMANSGGETGGYFFYDLNAKYNHTINDRNRLYVSGYFGKDKFYFRYTSGDSKSKGDFRWGNATATTRWNHIFNDKVFANTSFIFTHYQFSIGTTEKSKNDEYSLRFSSGIQDWSVKYDLDYVPNPNHYIRVGALLTYHRFRPSATVIKGTYFDEFESKVNIIESFENGIYAEDDWRINHALKVNYGARLSHYYARGKHYVKPEPRISARYRIAKDLSMKASYALMNQYVHLLSNTGIGLPTDLWVPATEQVGPQQSQQTALGLSKDLPNRNLLISLEGYYKRMDGIIAYRDGASFMVLDFEDPGIDNTMKWQENITSGKGKSYGAELLLQRKRGKLSGWIGYTLSWTKHQFDDINFGKEYFARYDRRHDLSLVAIYKLSERITLSATWVYGTGQAVTLPLASYPAVEHFPTFDHIDSGFMGNYIRTVEDFGEKNSFRMKPYHRLDVAAQWHKELKRCTKTFELGLYNAYSRKNPFFYYTSYEPSGQNGEYVNRLKQVSLFPIIPSVSWTYKW